jgi:uncharacterized protein Yka (UPF0111/DUF47 family)
METQYNAAYFNDLVKTNQRDIADRLEGLDVVLELLQTASKTVDEKKRNKVLEYADKLQKSVDVYNRTFFENLALKQQLTKLFAENQALIKEIARLKEEIDFNK